MDKKSNIIKDNKGKIKYKLIIIQMAVVLFSLLLLGSILLVYQQKALLNKKEKELFAIAKVTGLNIAPFLRSSDRLSGQQALETLKEDPSIVNAKVLWPEYREFVKYSRNSEIYDFPTLVDIDDLYYIYTDDHLIIRYFIRSNEELVGILLIRSNLNQVNDVIDIFVVSFAVGLVMSLLLSFLITFYTQRLITHPIRNLLRGVQFVSSSETYTYRVEKKSDDELGELTDEFNRMVEVINYKNEELVNQNSELEVKIVERTKSLEQTNERLEENLVMLERNNEELENFNHVVSHDLKAPLRAIHTMITFIEEDLGDKVNEDVKKQFDLLKSRTLKMDGLIGSLLSYAKIGKEEKVAVKFDLTALLKELSEVVNDKNLHIINIPDKPFEISANKIEIEQVFQNLLQNAIKYNDKKQALVDVILNVSETHYEFEVKDNGPGIAPQYHKKIFNIFSQINPESEVESTGIGLSIVKKIISENHGDILVESDGKLGTTFKITMKIPKDLN